MSSSKEAFIVAIGASSQPQKITRENEGTSQLNTCICRRTARRAAVGAIQIDFLSGCKFLRFTELANRQRQLGGRRQSGVNRISTQNM